MSRGHTLLEILVVLALASLIGGVAARGVRRVVDDATALSAREAFIGAVSQARTRALEVGAAQVVIVPGEGSIHVASVGPPDPWRMGPHPRLVVEALPRRDTLVLAFGPLGVGQFASASVTFRLGEARRTAVVSTYGRVRRR